MNKRIKRSCPTHSINKFNFKLAPLAVAIGTSLLLGGCFHDEDGDTNIFTTTDSSPFITNPTPSKGTAAGAYTLLTSGGSNTSGTVTTGIGGNGGDLDMGKYGGFSELGIFNSGAADASFTPSSVTANLGDNPLMVTADTTVSVVAVGPATAGTPYFVAGDQNMYLSDGDAAVADEPAVTGISVATGTTLTLDPNWPLLAPQTSVQLNIDNDLDNHGLLTTGNTAAGDRADLDIDLSSYMGNSAIETHGAIDGQDGGDVDIDARGIILNGGDVFTHGFDGTAGNAGSGGSIDLTADHRVENTGTLTSTGGDSTSGDGGFGGSIYLYAMEDSVWNNATLDSSGGAGSVAGGDGGNIELAVYDDGYGGLLNSGMLDSRGGNGTTGSGGHGGSIDIYGVGGDTFSTGDLYSRGGTGISGGNGGSVDLYGKYGDGTINADEDHSGGHVDISGNIDSRGGDATDAASNAGAGGSVDLYNNPYYYGFVNSLRLLGYTEVNTSGGDGANGGDGGYVDLYADYGWSYAVLPSGYGLAGDVINEVPINATGGNSLLTAGAGGLGGNGGYIEFESSYDYALDVINPETGKLVARTMNSGTLNNSGGANFNASSNSNGRSGYIWMWGYNGVTNTAALTSNGGDDGAADGGIDGYGGYADWVELYAEEAPVSNSGAIDSNGGDGEYDGGYSEDIELFGPSVTNSADLTGNGGDAVDTLVGSTGGNGAYIELWAFNGLVNSGALSNSGGDGTTDGTDGTTWVEGHCQSGPGC